MRFSLVMVIAVLAVVMNLSAVGPVAEITDYCQCVDHDCRRQWCVKDLLP